MIQTSFLLVLGQILPHHLAISCQVNPSEYAYHRESFVSNELPTANCMNYSSGLDTSNVARREDFTHCHGSPLRLTDSYLGSDQSYVSSDYYAWRIGASSKQLLFIFPEGVKLTTITLHYYNDNTRGLSRMRFYAVPDEFKVWQSPIASYSYAEIAAVTSHGEPAGRKNVSTDCNFNIKRVLLLSLNNALEFAISEVEFFTCNVTTAETSDDLSTSVSQSNNMNTSSKLVYTTVKITETLEVNKTTIEHMELFQNNNTQNIDQFIPEYSQLDYQNMEKQQMDTEKSNTDYATYAAVDKKTKKAKIEVLNESQNGALENVCEHKVPKSLKYVEPEEYDDVEKQDQQCQRKENIEEMYAVVQKKPKKCEERGETAPPIPSHTIESLYTAVEKKPK